MLPISIVKTMLMVQITSQEKVELVKEAELVSEIPIIESISEKLSTNTSLVTPNNDFIHQKK